MTSARRKRKVGRPAVARGEVMDWLERQVRSGRLKAGDLLPGERTLALRVGVCREAVRAALLRLDRAGITEVRPGRRRRFRPPPGPSGVVRR